MTIFNFSRLLCSHVLNFIFSIFTTIKNQLVIILCLTASLSWAETLRIPRDQTDVSKLPNKLLMKALTNGNTYTPTFPYADITALPFSTRIEGVRNGELDIFSAMTSKELEEEFQAIYIPIYKGLMGMRLAIIRKEDKNLFANVNSLQDLQKFTAGQGTYWADSKILAANNVPLVKEMKYSNMFRMLEAERFMYFPRGAHEPWSEVEQRPELNLTVDEHIMLSYKAPFYFFVAKKNKALAAHLTEQFNQMINDGTFMELFYQDEDVAKAISLSNFHHRTVIEMHNPYLSAQTPIDNQQLWYNPTVDKNKYTMN